jgi:predicted nucleic acid-binding Zn ribbon protein
MRADRDRGNTGPRPLEGSLDVLSARLGMEGARALGRLFSGWTEIVGPAMAEHVRPIRIDPDALVVTVDHPAWATQVRLLGDTLLDTVSERVGVDRPTRLEVRVRG